MSAKNSLRISISTGLETPTFLSASVVVLPEGAAVAAGASVAAGAVVAAGCAAVGGAAVGIATGAHAAIMNKLITLTSSNVDNRIELNCEISRR
jgi:hypothetical protein